MNKSVEKIIHNGDVLVRECGALRRLTLNRPKALNALTLDMAATVAAYLRAWAGDETVGAVLIDGAGERGLCAGGDLRALYDAAKAKNSFPAKFWATEYHLDVLIARYPKPVVAIMDGVVMGGGVGVSAHAAHRVVTERSSIAMPEVSIGYFPDVGVSFLLARSPGQTGMHLALTGSRIGAADAIYCGLADIHVPAASLADLPSRLADCNSAQDVRAALKEMSSLPTPGKLPAARPWIDDCYGAQNVEEILDRLRTSKADNASSTLATLEKMSPTSLKITLRNIRSAVSFTKVEESFQQDYRISLACIAEHDFIEGIRATIVDKDRNPVWRPPKLEDVTPAIVGRHFRSVAALELNFTD
jgi:enoyl-CoA hydratase